MTKTALCVFLAAIACTAPAQVCDSQISSADRVADVRAKLTCLADENSGLRKELDGLRSAMRRVTDENSGLRKELDTLQSGMKQVTPELEMLRSVARRPPHIATYLLSGKQSDDACKARAASVLQGGSNLTVKQYSTEAVFGSRTASIICDDPHYLIIVTGPEPELNRQLRDNLQDAFRK